jgi:hypothetical protein
MKRVTAAILTVLVAVTSACSREGKQSGAGSGTSETLSLYSSAGRAGPVSQLGLPLTPLKDAFLVGPHLAIAFSGWAVATELTGEKLQSVGVVLQDLSGSPVGARDLRAPEGHELFMVDAANSETLPISRNDPGNAVSFALVVDGVSRPLGNALFAYNLRDALVTVVPVGAQVRLEVTDAGRTQSLDLRTGERIDAAAAKDLRLSGPGIPARLLPAGTTIIAADSAGAAGLPEEASSRAFAVDVPETLAKFTVVLTTAVPGPGFVRDAGLSDGSREVTLRDPKR